jgi:hypothetical protein
MKRPQDKPKAKSRRKSRLSLIERAYPGGKSVEFPGMKGRRIERIELITAGDYHAVSIRFKKKITLHLVIDPGFTLKANLRDWKGRRRKKHQRLACHCKRWYAAVN